MSEVEHRSATPSTWLEFCPARSTCVASGASGRTRRLHRRGRRLRLSSYPGVHSPRGRGTFRRAVLPAGGLSPGCSSSRCQASLAASSRAAEVRARPPTKRRRPRPQRVAAAPRITNMLMVARILNRWCSRGGRACQRLRSASIRVVIRGSGHFLGEVSLAEDRRCADWGDVGPNGGVC